LTSADVTPELAEEIVLFLSVEVVNLIMGGQKIVLHCNLFPSTQPVPGQLPLNVTPVKLSQSSAALDRIHYA
jgi:hypothetical protein